MLGCMVDAQINMAIEQMEAVANNPTQLKMAADQMKKSEYNLSVVHTTPSQMKLLILLSVPSFYT